ncbi:zinc finger protein ZFAT [Patella vulgata]|uniref:zinc finger protein ZFAT n=1 Tax=Patella vulgata TaxID=6465 RepID=UPI00217FFAB0|nr:zinc finger protein ZFAT [Patella vulgata]
MAVKAEPMEYETEMDDTFRNQGYSRGSVPKSIDLTDDQKVMLIPSSDEPYITGIFHRSSEQISNRQNFNMLPSDITAMQQEHNFFGGAIRSMKSSPKQELIDEEYPTYTIARSEIELNSRSLPKKYKCKFCVYKTSYKSDLNRHLRRHAKKDNVYNCDVCGLPFRSISKVYSHRQQVHMLTDDDELNLCCSLCSYRCAEKDIELFQLHVHQHIEDNTCNVCNKSFNSPQAVDKHKKIFHQVPSEVVFPPQAQRSSTYFPDVSHESSSTEIQTKEPELELLRQDDSSGASSRNISNRSTPLPVGETSITSRGNNSKLATPAEICRESSRSEHNKRKDIDVNKTKATKEGNDLSDKSAQQSKNLADVKSPQRLTTNIPELVERSETLPNNGQTVPLRMTNSGFLEKKFTCDKCNQVFDVMRDLFVHMSVCLQEELNTKTAFYNCPICNFSTEVLESFSNHMVKHTIDKFSCDICNKPFSQFRNVLSHKRKIHRIDLRTRRSPTKLKAFGFNNKFLRGSNDTKLGFPNSNCSPYSKETMGQIKKLAEKELREADTAETNDMVMAVADPKTQGKFNIANSNISEKSPPSGRYTRLVSDFDDFMVKPFACSLCFFRTGDVNELILHVKNHVSGSYGGAIPDIVRFNFTPVLDSNSHLEHNETIYNLNISSKISPTSQNFVVINNENDVMETASVIAGKTENQVKQIKRLDNLLKNSRKNKMFISRASNRNSVEKKSMSCDICNKEFSMRLLAKRHMEKIHNIKKFL